VQFKNIIGQLQVKQQLTDLVQQNRLSHALLFLSKEGSGGLALALALSQFIVCESVRRQLSGTQLTTASLFGEETMPVSSQPIPTDSCGICPSCMRSMQFVHPDIHYSYPTVTRKAGEKPVATDFISEWRDFLRLNVYGNLFDWIEMIKEKENSQGKITSEECNDIIRKLGLKSFESGYKILIMWMPELMGNEGNKLLKLIEEPPPDTLFILVTENESQMLQTIVSRCQLIRVPALEDQDIEQALIDRNNTEPQAARQVAVLSEGSYREAMQLVIHAEEDWLALLREWLNAMLKTGPVAQTKWVEEISRLGREKQKQFLRFFNHLLEQAIRARVLSTSSDGAERDFSERLNKVAGVEQQQAMVEEIDKACYYIERNANAKMLFHALTIKLYHIIQDKIVLLTD
jgi:DNA polymerase III subunit delta'